MTDRLNMGQLWNAARTGEALARERGIPPGQPTNSFTHAFFSAYITNHYSENAARVLGDWRERVGGNSERDRNVDLWNNGQGREVGRNLPLNTPVGAIADAVKQRMDSGGLVMNKNDPRVDPQSFPRDLLPGGISGSMNNWGLFDPMGNPVSGDVNAAYSAARNWSPPQDPLVLDLNGNGIQTVGLDGASSVLFDHDGDGVRTGTGWIAGDDGILVLDRNGNGAVDSGRELFGDNTPLPDGSVASNGFEALAQHDTNGDGQIDAQDPTFHSLRVWQDLNQNGVSEANELRTLDALGVRSIGVQAISTNIWLGNGNTQVYSGTFTRTDGTSGQSGSAELTGSLLLAANHFYREFTDDPLVTPTARALPQSGGSGSVRDLREAMSLGTNASQELQTVVAQFSSAQERDVQRGLLPTLIHAWASTSSMPPGMERFGAPSGSTGPNRNRADAVAQFASASPGLYEQITTLERFNGDEILEQLLVLHSGSTWDPYLHQWVGYSYYVVQISGAQQAFLDAAWRSLEESVYGSLVIQTRLAEYWAAVDVLIDGDSISFDLTAFEALLNEARAANEREATWDLYDLNKYGHDRLLEVGFDGMETLREWMAGLPAGSTLRSELAAGGLIHGAGVASDAAELYLADAAGSTFDSGGGHDLLSGGAGSDHLSGGAGNDTVHGGDGNDWLLGGEGFNFVSGGRGDDAIDSSSGDTVEGGEGNDQLKGRGYFDTEYRFNLGDGQDSIDDRRYGSDTSGGAHDRIVFGAGVQLAQVRFERQGEHLVVRVGQTDRIDIYNYFGAWNWGVIEHFFFADGTQWNVEDVLRMIAGGSAQHDIIQAGDGPDDIYAGGGDDSVNGMAGDDRIFGEDGNDTLHGESGANLLDGGSGNDHLVSTGSDTVIGGHGNDLLDTNAYADTLYRFGRGDGQDVIRDRQSYDYSGGASDTLVFGAGIAPSEVSVRRSSDHQLVLQIGPADRIQIVNYFGEWNWGRIENIRFADGTQWDYAQVTRLMVRGTDGNDAIVGAEGVDVVHGGLGSDHISGLDANDSLYGQAGDDTLVGGAGVNWLEGGDGNDAVESDGHGDTLVGGAGADSLIARGGPTIFLGGAGDGDWMESRYSADDEYRFSLGDGQDAMRDGSWLATSGGYDKAVFGPGISYEMLRFERSDWELRIRVSETDRLTVLNYFADAGHIEEIRFATDADMVLRGADVQEALANGGAIPVGLTLSGSGVLTGGSARDVLTATGYGTVLNGYAGADKLGAVANGSVFDLTFSGGAGNDTISGSYGRDVYKFNAGDGHDVVTDDVRSLGGGAADFFFEHPDTPTYQDQLDLGPGITPSSVSRTRVGNDLVLQFGGSADSVTVRNWFDGTTFNRIERITFANGTVWTAADADAGLGVGMNTAGAGTMTGSPYADTLVASAYGAQIAGSLGDDTLGVVQDGAIFDVTFKGGRGNDVINGSYARDFYRFNLGDGQDVITDDVRSLGQGVADYFTANPLTETYQDWLLFGEGVDPAAVSRARSGADLVLSIGSGADAIRVKNWFDGTLLSKIEGISFASGTVWSWSELEGNLADPVQRSAGGTLNGSGTSDTLTATAGGAIVLGYAGNDFLSAVANGAVFDVTFVGGRGNDSIIGSYARDHYRYELGDGHDKIRDDVRRLSQDVADYFAANPTAETYQDRLSFGAGIDPTGVTRLRDGNDLVLTVNAHDSVTIQDWFDGTIFNKIELIGFANGTVWAADSITG